jgi:4-amino-4-deoxy-L-arabinose transferase-like glycosyltransferase
MPRWISYVECYGCSRLSRRHTAILLCAVFLLGLVLRLVAIVFVGGYSAPPMWDGISYDILAHNLVSGNGFALDSATAFRPPGYPFFLALIYLVFGHHYEWIRIWQALLGALAPLLMYRLAERLWSWRVGGLAALGMALHPLLVYFTQAIYPETLVILLVCLLLVLVTSQAGPDLVWRALFVGLTLGAMSLIRPDTLVLSALFALWTVFRCRARLRGIVAAGLLLVGTLGVVLPWTWRNYREFDSFILVSTNGGVNMWAGNNPLARGGRVDPSPETWLGEDPPQNFEGWTSLGEVQSDQRFRQTALAWVREHPAEFLRLWPRKLSRALWINFGAQHKQVKLPGLAMLAYVVFLGASLAGVLLSIRRWKRLVPLYVPVVQTMLVSVIFFGGTRQSALLMPVQVLFAALAVDRLLQGLIQGAWQK